ncbi:ATP-grasp domain-containing protein [Streptomyces sp. NPDC050636]|uniref:ATP-grasp domain-containing protein n=1 Tax=Streptomyces sp. NPDC050636 TaxID=3154510 RepID=UPI003414D80E
MMSTVIVTVVPNSAVRPADIAEAAQPCGLSPIFVSIADTLDEPERAEYESFGPVVQADKHELTPAVVQLRDHRASGVTTFSEGMVPFTAHLAHDLGLPFHDRDTAVRLTDKGAQRRRLAERGVESIWSVVVASRSEALALLAGRPGPVVVKPVRGQSSTDVHLLETAADFPPDLTPTAERPFVMEEYLRGRDEGEFGDYVSVESFVADGRTHTIGVTSKFPMVPPFREHGHFIPSHLSAAECDDIARLAGDAALALGVRQGLVHTEFKLTPEGPRIIEVNGRLGGFLADMYRRGTGVNLLEVGIRVACGQPVALTESEARSVEFQYFGLSPLPGGVFRDVSGIDTLLKEQGIVSYLQRLAIGADLPPMTTSSFMDVLGGSATDYEEMWETIDRGLSHLQFTFEQLDGTTSVWQAKRGAMVAVQQP